MKTTFKRATALLLSLLMVFSVCSTALVVYAADADGQELDLDNSKPELNGNTTGNLPLNSGTNQYYYVAPATGMLTIKIRVLSEKYVGDSSYTKVFDKLGTDYSWTVNGAAVSGRITQVYAKANDKVAITLNAPQYTNGTLGRVQFTIELNQSVVNYVSIGDSMANGYGFEGYHQDSNDRNDYDFIAGTGMYGVDAYPLQFEEYLASLGYAVNHTKLAPSALLAEDLLYLLDGREEFDDGWSGYKDYVGTYTDAELKPHFQNAITDADVITMGIGNAAFGAFMLDRVTSAFGVFGATLDEDEKLTLEDALLLVEDEEFKQELVAYYDELVADLNALIPAEMAEQFNITDACNIVAYTAASYVVNYKLVLEKILEMNPDVEIVLVGLLNTTYGMNITDDNGNVLLAFGDVMDGLFSMLNAYMAGLPAVLQATGEYEEAVLFYAEQPEPKFICQEFQALKDANWGNIQDGRLSGDVVRDRNIAAYNGSLKDMIALAFAQYGIVLPSINLADVEAFEANVPSWTIPNLGFVPNGAAPVYTSADEKNLSIAIYLAIEDAVAASTDTLDIPLTGLLTIATDISSVFTNLDLNVQDPTVTPAVARETLGEYLTSTDTLKGMCKVYGLFKVGNGMSVHPTPEGHDDIAESVINAYAGKHTVQQETIENAMEILALLGEYYDEAYAYAYDYAEQSGYIAAVTGAIDNAYEAVANIAIPFPDGTTEAFQVQAFALRAEALETLKAAKALIETADVLDQESLDALLALLGEAAEDLAAMAALLEQGAVDVNTLAIIPAIKAAHAQLVNEIIPAIDAMLKEAVIAGTKKFVELAKTALGDLADAAVKAAIKFAPELDAMLYDYFYNNPEEVIAFFTEYGYIIVDLAEKYGDEALGVAAYVLVTYGEDVAKFFMENYETIFEGIVAWADKYGERTIEMIQVYAEATGLCDAVRAEIAVLEEKLAALEAQLEYQLKVLEEELGVQLEVLKAELEALKAELLLAAEPYKQAILAEIAKVEALIAEIEAKIEQAKALIAEIEAKIVEIKNQIAELNARLQNLVSAIKNLDEALKYLAYAGIEAAAAMVQQALNNVAYAVSQLVGFVSEEAAKALDALIEEAKAFLDEAFYNATHADYAIDNTSSHVALGDNTMTAQLFGKYLQSVVDAEDVYYTYKTTDLTVAGSKISGLPAVLAENLETVAAADLITIGYGYEALAEETVNLLFDLILLGTAKVDYNIDLVAKVGPEAAAEIDKIVADVHASLIENNLGITLNKGGFPVADAVVIAVKYFAYYAAEYAAYMPQAVYAIHEINPEALIMINAISNPIAGASIAVAIPEMGLDVEIAFGDYLNYICDAIYLESAVLAAIDEKVVFVPATGVETTFTNKTVSFNGYQEFIYLLMNYESVMEEMFNIETKAEGNVAVVNKMVDALNITVEHSALLGDVDGDGAVTIKDAVLVLRFDAQLPDVALDLSVADVTGDGMVNITDAVWILRYDAKLVEKFPASK